MRPIIWTIFGLLLACISPQVALAHVSEQGFVLLLPTDLYIFTGCAAVVASILIVTVAPGGVMRAAFRPIQIGRVGPRQPQYLQPLANIVSLATLAMIIGLIIIGTVGTRDPLANLMPLTIWTLWWIAIVMAQCVVGNLWRWINPWTGISALLLNRTGQRPLADMPYWVGTWPAIVLFVLFNAFLIADIAPDDPARLANVVFGYLVLTFAGILIFGRENWLAQCEFISVFLRFASKIAPIHFCYLWSRLAVGLPGWRAFKQKPLTPTQAIFALAMLASGSFDGLNETFWWLAQIGINPLEFPGRSAVFVQSVSGLIGANLLLLAIFSACVWLGLRLAAASRGPRSCEPVELPGFVYAFRCLAISILPIAFAYHGSHYLIAFLINSQYLIAAISDPLASGANFLGLENYQVTTGFLNTRDSVRQIWLTQAGLIVFGHILAVLMAHSVIVSITATAREAFWLHLPIAAFMTAYTWFGLWLLASPRGV